MSVKTVSLATPYRWLAEAFALCRAHPRVVFGAASLLMVFALLPTLLQLLLEAALQPSLTMRLGIQIVFSVIGLFLLPPVVGGFYRVLHALSEGRPAQAKDVLAVFAEASTARRLIATNLMFMLVSVLVVIALGLAFGGKGLLDFFATLAARAPGSTALPPPLPPGVLPLLSTLMIAFMVISTAQTVASAQIALSSRAPLSAIGDGFQVALRNIGAFLLFYLPMALIGSVLMLIVGLIAALLAALFAMLSKVLAVLVLVPLVLGLMLLLYALMLGFFYRAWRDTLGGDSVAPAEPQHQIAV